MKCSKCGQEFEGNFCSFCGQPAPREVSCQFCETRFKGAYCPNCGAEYIEPIESRCRNLYDFEGNYINVDNLAGVYLSVSELRGYFLRNTDYPEDQIEELAQYIYEEVDGVDFGFLESASVKSAFEGPSKRVKADERAQRRAALSTQANVRPSTKKQRIQENKQNGIACCPKCGSTSLSANKKGFGIGKAVVGAAIAGGIGMVAGNIGAKKVWITCLNCGHRWKV